MDLNNFLNSSELSFRSSQFISFVTDFDLAFGSFLMISVLVFLQKYVFVGHWGGGGLERLNYGV